MQALLTDPNIVYVLLVAGALLAFFAALTPGTGMLEISGLFALLLAGYGIYVNDRPVNLWAVIILLVGVIPFMLALRRWKNYTFLVVAIAAFVLGSIYLFQGDAWWQPGVSPLLAIPVSVIVAGLVWWMTRRAMEAEKQRPAHDLGTLIGQIGEAKTAINAEGSVQVGGELWSAFSAEPIPAGANVRVLGRDGLMLKVQAVDSHTPEN